MNGTLRALSVGIAIFYFAASAYHLVQAGTANPASIAEALLGVVMLAGLAAGFSLILAARGRTRST